MFVNLVTNGGKKVGEWGREWETVEFYQADHYNTQKQCLLVNTSFVRNQESCVLERNREAKGSMGRWHYREAMLSRGS